jgi:hypothetical protein
MLGIAGIEAQRGMLGIARYALFRAIGSAVNNRQRATRDWLCTQLLGRATEVIPKQLCNGVRHGMRSILTPQKRIIQSIRDESEDGIWAAWRFG